MKKVKKYYPGTSGLVYDNSKSVGVLAPQKEDPKKFTTGKFLFPQQKTLGNIVDNKVMSQDYLSSKGPSFMDKAGDFMGNYGNIIGSVGTGIASLINANKKQDPTGRPYKTGTNMIKSKKSKLIKYQEGTENIIGPGPLDNLPQMSPEQIKAFNDYENKRDINAAIERVNNMVPPVSPLTPKMASFRASEQTSMTPKLNRIPMEKQSRRERKEENRRLEGMARAPITYNENAFVGPSNEELQLGRLREDAQSARKTYEARLAGENARSAYEAKQKGTPITDALLKRSMSSQAFKETMSPYKSFKDMTPAQQKQYRAGIASGKEFTIEGIGKYAAASKEQQAKSSKMAAKSGGAKPLIKMKENPYIKNGKVVKDYTTKEGLRIYHNTEGTSRVGDPKTGRMGKYEYNPKTDKFGIKWDTNKVKGKTARHTSEDPGEKMVNKSAVTSSSNKNSVDNTIQRERESYKKRKEQEQADLRQQGINAMEKLKKENPQAYDFQMRLNAKREALKKQK